jgi:hypothetical protein
MLLWAKVDFRRLLYKLEDLVPCIMGNTSLVQNRLLVARRFRLCWRGFSTPPILHHYSRRNSSVAHHATIIPSAGGAVAVMPPFHAFGGVRDHATITFSDGVRSDMRDHTDQYFVLGGVGVRASDFEREGFTHRLWLEVFTHRLWPEVFTHRLRLTTRSLYIHR